MKKLLALLALSTALMGCDNKPAEQKATDTTKEAPKAATETPKPAEEKK